MNAIVNQNPNQIKRLTQRDLEISSDTRLFVLNNAEPRGDILITISKDKGRDQLIVVPPTWIPMDLTMQCRREDILNSPDFRRVLARQFIIAVDPDQSEAFLAENITAQNELDRVLGRAGGANTLAQNSVTSRLSEIKSQHGSHAVPDAGQHSDDTISGPVLQVISRCNTDGGDKLDEKEGLALLMGMRLSKAELAYIAKNAQQSNLKEFAASKL